MSAAQKTAAWAFFAGPLAWIANLLAGYVLAHHANLTGDKSGVYAMAVLTALVAALGVVLDWGARGRTKGEPGWHFVATGGLVLNGFFFVVIAASGLAAALQGAGD